SPFSALFVLFFFRALATTVTYTLSLHDALPIFSANGPSSTLSLPWRMRTLFAPAAASSCCDSIRVPSLRSASAFCRQWRMRVSRSEEHTSELQSRENLVCRLLLEKKNTSRIIRE